jgi:hypothetical protein
MWIIRACGPARQLLGQLGPGALDLVTRGSTLDRLVLRLRWGLLLLLLLFGDAATREARRDHARRPEHEAGRRAAGARTSRRHAVALRAGSSRSASPAPF